MAPSAEMIRIALLALLTGAALPLLIQLFVTLRALKRSAESIERRLDQSLRDLNALTADVRQNASGASSMASLVGAAVPAVVAAVRAFRTSMSDTRPTATETASETARETASETASNKQGEKS